MKLLCLTSFLLLLSCASGWKVRYLETQRLLDSCLALPLDTVFFTTSSTVSDTLLLPAAPADYSLQPRELVTRIDTVTLERPEKDFYPVNFKPSYVQVLTRDSLEVWIRVLNTYEYANFEQHFEVFDYTIPATTVQDTVYRTVKTHDWWQTLIAMVVGFFACIVLYGFDFGKNRKYRKIIKD